MLKEWARSADDILWRRSKLGLRFSDAEFAALEAYVSTNPNNESV
jgi:glycerol-3-phosphate dehydrogenase